MCETYITEDNKIWIDSKSYAKLEQQRDDLLEACEKMQQYKIAAEKGRLNDEDAHEYWESVMSFVEAAIAKALPPV